MTTETTDNAPARSQAEAQLRSIEAMLARLEHARACDGDDDCDLDSTDMVDALGYVVFTPDSHDEHSAEYHNEDKAREAIYEDPLSVEVRSGWHTPGEETEDEEFCILLCTGGPAVRIMGELGEYGEPRRAWLEYQDWGTPWTMYVTMGADNQALLDYAGHFLGG